MTTPPAAPKAEATGNAEIQPRGGRIRRPATISGDGEDDGDLGANGEGRGQGGEGE